MSDKDGASPRPSQSRRTHRPSPRSESHHRSRSRDRARESRRRSSSNSSEDRYANRNVRRCYRSRSSSSRSSDYSRSKKSHKNVDVPNSGLNSSKDSNKQTSSHSSNRYKRSKYSHSRSRSRDRYYKKRSRRRTRSRSSGRPYSSHNRRDSRSYSSNGTSPNDSGEDIDGIALDESPPPSWNKKNKKKYRTNYNNQYMQYQTFQVQPPPVAPFKNDGSFLEMFKKMQETQNKEKEQAEAVQQSTLSEIKKPALSFIGKRRGGRVLKTGVVQKAKAIDEQTVEDAPKDAWSVYMQEVKKYREAKCDEEVKTRPLVK